MERASRPLMFSPRKKPPHAANLYSEGSKSCNDTSGKSVRLFHRASDTSSSSEHDHSIATSGAMERSRPGKDGPGTSLEPCPLRDTTNFRGQLTTSFTNREREPLFRRICTDAGADADSNHCGGHKESPSPSPLLHPPSNALCSTRTVDHGFPETK